MCILFSIDDNTCFFYGKHKANERAGHLMVSDYRRPRPRATPEELQERCAQHTLQRCLMRNAVA